MEAGEAISYIQLAGLLITPIGFFFWVKFKIGQTDETLTELKHTLKEDIIQLRASKNGIKRDLESRIKEYKEDQSKVNIELKAEITSLRQDISTSKTEILTAISNIK